jgi:hypothetical protein
LNPRFGLSRARFAFAVLGAGFLYACSSPGTPNFAKFHFPKGVFVGDVDRPYTTLGRVKTKVNFSSLDVKHEEGELCRNYYNKASSDLLKRAKEVGGDAVIDIKSVVLYENGQFESYKTPECSDDGEEGQILLQGIAVKWKPVGPSPTPGASPMPAAAKKQ